MRNKNSKIQGRSLYVVKVVFHTIRELLLKARIRPFWEHFFFFKRSSYFEKGRDLREPLLDPVASVILSEEEESADCCFGPLMFFMACGLPVSPSRCGGFVCSIRLW